MLCVCEFVCVFFESADQFMIACSLGTELCEICAENEKTLLKT